MLSILRKSETFPCCTESKSV